MPRAIIQRNKPKHKILYIQPLMRLIQDYLQYEEQLTTYIYFKLTEPIRPLAIPYPHPESLDDFQIFKYNIVNNNITNWYIQLDVNDKSYKLKRQAIYCFYRDNIGKKLFLECKLCKEYVEIVLTRAAFPLDGRGCTMYAVYCPENDTKIDDPYFCKCSIEKAEVKPRRVFIEESEFELQLACHYARNMGFDI